MVRSDTHAQSPVNFIDSIGCFDQYCGTSAPCEYARSPIPSVCRKPGAFLFPGHQP